MKKVSTYFFVALLSVVIFLLGFNQNISKQPHSYYQVYLDGELMGVIESKKELENYINSQADIIRQNVKEYKLKLDAIETFNKYQKDVDSNYSNIDKVNYIISNRNNYNLTDMDIDNLNFYKDQKLYSVSDIDIKEMEEYVSKNDIYQHVSEIFTPNGIEIKKTYTYNDSLIKVEELYKNIVLKKSYTVSGYRFIIKGIDEADDIEVYTLDRKIFSDAIEDLITIFVDDTKYEAYKNNNQAEIVSTGSIIENIYVNQEITYKAVNIPVEEKIYTSSKDLSAYLLYGSGFEEKTVKVKLGDSIESIAFDNQISVQEFLIFNPQYTSRDNLLVSGTDVTISKIDPKIQIVVETYEVVDKETDFATVERYDETLNEGSIIVTDEGEKGLERVSQNVKSINGEISYVDPAGKETIKSSTPKVITIGTKYVPNVGSLSSWGWPTNSGYTLSSYYGYRLAVFGEGNFHSGIDVAGTGYGSPVYAVNNGTIEEMKVFRDSRGNYTNYGIYVLINHNNGYYSAYGHLSGFAPGLTEGMTVSRGDVIGYIGSTGWATGPHLHFEIRTCKYYSCVTNPLKYYR